MQKKIQKHFFLCPTFLDFVQSFQVSLGDLEHVSMEINSRSVGLKGAEALAKFTGSELFWELQQQKNHWLLEILQ